MVRQRTPRKAPETENGDIEQPLNDDVRESPNADGKGRHRLSPSASRRISFIMVVTGFCLILYSSMTFLSEQDRHERVVVTTSPPKLASSSSSPSLRKSNKMKAKGSSRAANIIDQNNDSSKDNRQLTECGIWMAPSMLRPFPGWGIFSTRHISMDESILHQPDAVSIPLHDMKRRRGMPNLKDRKQLWAHVFSNYVWDYGVPDHNRYDNPPDMVDFQPGFGSLPNHHCVLASLGAAATTEHPPYSDGLLEAGYDDSNSTAVRRHGESPGTGAFSYSLGRDFYAKRDLKPGEEIFLNYGHCEREDEEPDESHAWKKKLIYPVDIKEASRILKLYEPFGSKKWPTNPFSNNQNSNLIPSMVKKEQRMGLSQTPKEDIVISILSKFDSPAARQELYDKVNAIKSESKTVVASQLGLNSPTKESYERLSTRKLWFEVAKSTLEPAGQRDPSWIKENGQCLENLVPKRSTIPDAGFGAFAQFEMKKGEIVVPAPVLHVVNKDALMLYKRHVKDPAGHEIGMSLLMNYCFGDSKSSMLLCPMTSAMLLNHCSSRTMDCGPNGPNAEIRWSSGWDAPSHEWREKTLGQIRKETRRLLSFEVVALRDIAPGEEVFIDYGIEWENAWKRHVEEWQPPSIDDNFATAQLANQQGGPIMKELVSGDLRKTVDHSYLFTACQYWEGESSGSESADVAHYRNKNYTQPNKAWEKMTGTEIIATYASSGAEFEYDKGGYVEHEEHSHWPCSVLREEGEGKYTVRIHKSPLRGATPSKTPWDENDVPRILTNYPQASIHYFVKASAIDHKLPNVFRQPIGLPNNLFPEQWKNRAEPQFNNSTLMVLNSV